MDVNIMIHCKQTEQNLTTKFHYHGQKHIVILSQIFPLSMTHK